MAEDVNRWQLYHLDPDGVELDAPQVGDFQEFGRGLDVNDAGDLLLCGVRPALLGEDAWVRWLPPARDGWTVPWAYDVASLPFDERTKDCAFIGDRIVVVGEAFGGHEKNELKLSRGFVVEFGVNGAALSEVVATASLTIVPVPVGVDGNVHSLTAQPEKVDRVQNWFVAGVSTKKVDRLLMPDESNS